MRDYRRENLTYDPIHGYIPFTSGKGLPSDEVAEQDLIDHPWVQRLRQIHQLQTAWWVYPTAEHTRFQHVLGVMHLASRAAEQLYDSLRDVCPDTPSRAYVELLLRTAGLLHDVGHGPFGHFFDDHFLAHYGQTHETLGSQIIVEELGDLIRGLRRTLNHALEANEQLDPVQVAYLIRRPTGEGEPDVPQWLRFLRALFSGVYTLDNMDFVLRDSYMTGYNTRAFDLDRLLQYTFFSPSGLTLHQRGLSALVKFIIVRAELFRSVYFHRTVRSIDLTLQDLFADSREFIFPGDPSKNLSAYRRLTEWSLLVETAQWPESDDPRRRELGQRWQRLLQRQVQWKLACERSLFFEPGHHERTSIFSRVEYFREEFLRHLPAPLRGLPLRFDLPRHVHRPGTRFATRGQNFIFDPARDRPVALDENDLVRQIPISWRICRVYAETNEHDQELSAVLDQLIGAGEDDKTNM